MKPAHILFLKYPEAGKVKTRLAKDIGDEKATELYKQLSENIIMSCAVPDVDMLIFISPYDRLADFKNWLGDELKYYPQADTDLGTRMFEAFQTAFTEGYNKCVLTGSDIPALNADVIYDALEKMDDAVIGKAKDGGYHLIGFKKDTLTDEVFKDMEWSTERVFSETVLRFQKAGLSYANTYELGDIDDIKDLKELKPYIEEILENIGIKI